MTLVALTRWPEGITWPEVAAQRQAMIDANTYALANPLDDLPVYDFIPGFAGYVPDLTTYVTEVRESLRKAQNYQATALATLQHDAAVAAILDPVVWQPYQVGVDQPNAEALVAYGQDFRAQAIQRASDLGVLDQVPPAWIDSPIGLLADPMRAEYSGVVVPFEVDRAVVTEDLADRAVAKGLAETVAGAAVLTGYQLAGTIEETLSNRLAVVAPPAIAVNTSTPAVLEDVSSLEAFLADASSGDASPNAAAPPSAKVDDAPGLAITIGMGLLSLLMS